MWESQEGKEEFFGVRLTYAIGNLVFHMRQDPIHVRTI